MNEHEIVPQEITGDEKNLALLANLLGIFTTVVGALVIWLIKKGKSPFVEEHSREALNFQITVLIAMTLGGVLSFAPLGFLLIPLITIYNIVMSIQAAMAARDGKIFHYPITLRLIQ